MLKKDLLTLTKEYYKTLAHVGSFFETEAATAPSILRLSEWTGVLADSRPWSSC